MLSDKPKVLILTSGYGDGHNSAARGIGEALEGRATYRVVDAIALAMPRAFKITRKGYLWVISRAPSLWRQMYDWSDQTDMSVEPVPGLGKVRSFLERELAGWSPDVVVCTYMVYPYMLDAWFAQTGRRLPCLTVVTDSLEINKSWLCSQTDAWAVTDEGTKQVMIDRGLDGGKIFVSGFPVSPRLPGLAARHPLSWKEGEAFKVLFFPQGSRAHAAAMLAAILTASGDIHVTCVMGRHTRRYYPCLRALKQRYGSRLALKGWTKKVPELMAAHHLVVGKAGGATTHECIAMSRPMLVNFRTPGQEEGNIELLERLGGGRFTETPAELAEALRHVLDDGGRTWKAMHLALERQGIKNGADTIVDWCLKAGCGELPA